MVPEAIVTCFWSHPSRKPGHATSGLGSGLRPLQFRGQVDSGQRYRALENAVEMMVAADSLRIARKPQRRLTIAGFRAAGCLTPEGGDFLVKSVSIQK